MYNCVYLIVYTCNQSTDKCLTEMDFISPEPVAPGERLGWNGSIAHHHDPHWGQEIQTAAR